MFKFDLLSIRGFLLSLMNGKSLNFLKQYELKQYAKKTDFGPETNKVIQQSYFSVDALGEVTKNHTMFLGLFFVAKTEYI